ncbi:phage tail tape measure protein [Streptomyces xanthochromogenes]|uniref:phage tail tape measure protein n=1 Tax=Streptomyces xanthochromogenes TaxID=67384 RepID=UPI0034458F1E
MANWNLSVDLRSSGNTLTKDLKESAAAARTLATNSGAAKKEVKELGTAARTAAADIKKLATESRAAARDVQRLGSSAGTTARNLTRYGDAARTADRNLNSLGGNSRTASRDLARMSGEINSAVRDLIRLADAARRADAQLNGLGGAGPHTVHTYSSATSELRSRLMSLAALLSGGALTMGAAELLKLGNEYQQAMNTFGATTNANALQMQRAGAVATQLGNDLKLPKATAADAAEAMVELAKAGFRTDQAISATRASLTLSAAAQVSAADSARYLGDMMDQFGLGADQASVAADTLAATANAASGGIGDIYYAMKYAGPVAHGMGVDMQSAAAGVGMLHKAGIIGQTAGTALRGMLTNLSKPTKQMAQGLETLGIEAYDAQGNFKGLRYVVQQLGDAQARLSQKDFVAATAKAFGKPALSGAMAIAHQGVQSYDALLSAVSQTGAATQLAAAQGKGLAGAMVQLKTQARQTGLAIYTGMSPGLEYLSRATTDVLSRATPRIEHFFQYLNAAAKLFGPDLLAGARKEFGALNTEIHSLFSPFKSAAGAGAADALHVVLTIAQLLLNVFGDLASGVEPVVHGLASLATGGNGVSSSLDLVVTTVDLAARAIGFLTNILGPIGHLVGSLVGAFGALPAPIQQFVLAGLLARRVTPVLTNLAGTVRGNVTGAFRSFNQQMQLQRTLAATSGVTLSRYGAAFAVLESRVPVVGRIATSFRTASAAGTGFMGTLRGIGAASGTAVRSLGSGLMGALGGPWGLAITAATVGLGYLATRQQQAAAAAAEHRAQVTNLTEALRQSNGAVDSNVRAIATENLMATKVKTTLDGQQRLIDVAKAAKIPMGELVDAYTNTGSSLDLLKTKLDAIANDKSNHFIWSDPENGNSGDALNDKAQAAQDLSKALGGLGEDFNKAQADAKSFNEGVNGSAKASTAYDRLKASVKSLADTTGDADSRTRALRQALDLLSGGSISLQAAQARVHEAVTQANDAIKDGVDKADGYSTALLKTNGQLDTTSKNGQALFSTYNDLADAAGTAATSAYDFAQSQRKSVPESIAAARQEMQNARDSAIKLAAGYGLSAEQAGKVADAMGLIPSQVSVLLTTKGVDSALADLLGIQAQFQQFPDKKTVTVEALGEDARKQLEKLNYQVSLIPGTRQYTITAPTEGARAQLDLLIQKLSVTNGKTLTIKAPSEGAIVQLEGIQDKVAALHGKTLTIAAPTGEAQDALQQLGFSIKENAKDKTVTISVPTSDPVFNANIIRDALDQIHSKTVTVTTYSQYVNVGPPPANTNPYRLTNADGNLYPGPGPGRVSHFAGGGMRENHSAQIARAGEWRVWAEDETGGEAYIPLSPTKRPRSRAIAEETVRRLGGKGIQWNASGSVTDWRYDPTTGTLYSPTDAGQAGHKTKQVKGKDVDYFDESAVEAKLKSSARANAAWAKNLSTVADRAGKDVADALAAMGEDGVQLTAKMASGTTKYVNEMAASLRGLAATAKASLTDYSRQLNAANTVNAKFASDLAKLAAGGFGDLAKQLAAQNDTAAQQLAAAAVADKGKAKAANAAAKTANQALTADQVGELVAIIGAISTSKTGIHDVAASTGLGEDDIITLATKASEQIRTSLGSRATKFLADLARAQKGLSYADGGIRPGLYATAAGAVTFAEPSTGGEAYIPLGANKRTSATRVLADVAGRFGLGLTDVRSTGQQVVIIREGGDTYVTVPQLHTGATASDIGAQVGRGVRRARRGGVAARA